MGGKCPCQQDNGEKRHFFHSFSSSSFANQSFLLRVRQSRKHCGNLVESLVPARYLGVPALGCLYPNARHTPGSCNLLADSTGGWAYGTPGYMTSYLSVQNNQQIVGQPGVEYDFSYGGNVICTVFGYLWSISVFGRIGLSEANYLDGGPNANGRCGFTMYCPNGVTPVCPFPKTFNASGAFCLAPYAHAYGPTFRTTGANKQCITPVTTEVPSYAEANCQ